MLNTIFDVIRDPSDAAAWGALVQCLLGLAILVLAVVLVIGFPALRPVGVLAGLVGLATVVVGHA